MIAALPLSVSAAGEYVPGNPRWSGYQNQVQWGRPAGAASGDSFEYEAQLLLGDDVVESKAVEIDTYLFFTNDVVTRPQEEYTIRVRARWIMIVGDPDGQYMVADVGEAEPPHEHSYTQKHDAAQHWQACSCGERLNVANHIYGDWRETKPATETEAGSRERDCTVCDYVQTETIPMLEHEHSYGDWQKDETQHWKECRCGEKTEVGNHTFGDWTITKEPNMTVTDYIVKCALGKNVRQTDELAPILSELKAQGRNLNQLTKLANMGRITLGDAENFTEAYTNLYGLIEEIYWEGE